MERDVDPEGPNRAAADAAADWVVREDRGLSAGERREFAAWRAADPRHAAEHARLRSTWGALDASRQVPELSALAEAALERGRARRRGRRRFRAATAAAAAALLMLAGWLQWGEVRPTPAPRFAKENYRVLAPTLQRTVLADGSVAELNGDSRIEVVYTATERRVRLLRGEAHFVVAKNPERPFHVSAGPVTVRAVGTAFNVRLAAEKIEVLVTEGKVRLEHADGPHVTEGAAAATPSLVEGQRAIYRAPTASAPPAIDVDEVNRAEIDHELGWQSTRLVFNNTPLDEVVEGFNRYNRHRLTLGDPRLRERTLTGIFRADNREGFVRLLRASVDVKAEQRTPHETVLLPIR